MMYKLRKQTDLLLKTLLLGLHQRNGSLHRMRNFYRVKDLWMTDKEGRIFDQVPGYIILVHRLEIKFPLSF